MLFYVTASKAELRPTRKWNTQSWFNKHLSSFGKNKRKNIRVATKTIKVLLHPSFQNLSATPLEGYILEKHFPQNENPTLDYLNIIKEILKEISEGKLDEYVTNHEIFSTWGWEDKNSDATLQIKNRAENIYNDIKDMNLEEFKKYLKEKADTTKNNKINSKNNKETEIKKSFYDSTLL